MERITEYDIKKAYHLDMLVMNVNHQMEEGWQPFGAVAIAHQGKGDFYVYIQAMVRYEKPNDGVATAIGDVRKIFKVKPVDTDGEAG